MMGLMFVILGLALLAVPDFVYVRSGDAFGTSMLDWGRVAIVAAVYAGILIQMMAVESGFQRQEELERISERLKSIYEEQVAARRDQA
jgi:hypothetical protein